MYPPAGSERKLKPSGFLIAAIGFIVTRATVLEALVTGGLPSGIAVVRLLPLAVGFGLIVLGASLAVSTFDREYVDTVARWTLFGTIGMLVVVIVSVFEPTTGVDSIVSRLATDVVVANALLGGAAGGSLIGIRSASNHRQRRMLSRQADRGVLLTRLLRHEVLNAVTAIDGHASLLYDEPDERSHRAIRESVDRIERTVNDVGILLRPENGQQQWLTAVDLAATLRRAADDASGRQAVDIAASTDSVTVRADDNLEPALADILTHATDRTERPVSVETAVRSTEIDVRILAEGSWLSETERTALTESLPKFDTPTVGYELPVARLLVEQYGGRIRTESDGRTVVVTLPSTTPDRTDASQQPGVTPSDLRRVGVAALLAGTAMGLVLSHFSSGLPIIGALYGVEAVSIGWITHLFHSVLFGVFFAAVLSHYDVRKRADTAGTVALLGAGFGVFLWLVAAGVVMSLWLNVVGIPTPLPNLTVTGLFGHVLWGTVLGSGYALLLDEAESTDTTDKWNYQWEL